ncbi:CesT family type III secretion system chaperone [Shewanella surugensis]|uniref:CesT family type III secretion system chaperone n=1 Tax=Shewanella surugensis TaxID=212020 RepID=A0ABT0LHW6_9GAMM|nr:CesT family type III secretion system chaperone [Shewanella surugensis]MCL1127294.1 CesT family type III secretion system chaperone [Shewanella surugensis]
MKKIILTPQQQVSDWLGQIGELIGIKLQLQDNGHAILQCGNNTAITIEIDSIRHLFYFYSTLCTLPLDPIAREPFYRKALELNAFSFSTAGAAISLDPRNESIVLTFMEKIDTVNVDSFANLLESFISLSLEFNQNKAFDFDTTQSNRPTAMNIIV